MLKLPYVVSVTACLAFLACGLGQEVFASQDETPVLVYFVRHGEVNMDKATLPLDDRGLERAAHLAVALERAPLTHVFSSHTLRARQTVIPAAESHGLSVTPLPPLGSDIGGEVVSDSSPSDVAVAPLSEALDALPPGSVALVGVNSDNLFGILNRLGVPLGTSSEPCELGRTCVPCLDNSCFPAEYDNLWVLVLRGHQRLPVLIWLKY